MTTENKVLIGIGVVTLLLIVIAVFSLGGNKGLGGDKATGEPKDLKTLIREDSHTKGPKNAKVTVVEFGDFQCPACGNAYSVVNQITNEYKKDVLFVYRNYPLPVHKNAQIAAEAAEAAGGQGKFFEMYDILFQNQKAWSESSKVMDEYFVKYAQQLKLDVEKFKKEVNEHKYKAKIEQDKTDGNTVGVNATPTFYINGVEQVGGLPYDEFKTKLDEALNSSSK